MYLLTAVFTGLMFSNLKENPVQQLTLGLCFGAFQSHPAAHLHLIILWSFTHLHGTDPTSPSNAAAPIPPPSPNPPPPPPQKGIPHYTLPQLRERSPPFD